MIDHYKDENDKNITRQTKTATLYQKEYERVLLYD